MKVKGKKGVRNHITLLRAPTRNSEGASCMTLTGCKNTVILEKSKRIGRFLLWNLNVKDIHSLFYYLLVFEFRIGIGVKAFYL